MDGPEITKVEESIPVYRCSTEFTVIAFFKFVNAIKLQANPMYTGTFAVTETGWCRGNREDPEAKLKTESFTPAKM